MNHKIVPTDALSLIVYEMGGGTSGGKSYLDTVLNYMESIVHSQAVALCSEAAEINVSKEYDRGYVKGLIEVTRFLREARDKGRDLRFRGTKMEIESITKRIV